MSSKYILFISLLLPNCLVGSDDDPPSQEIARASVIDGLLDANETGYVSSRLEQNAVVGQLVTKNNIDYQGCTGTVVGDRAVIAAGHCMVNNQREWMAGTEAPDIFPPEIIRYAVGDNVTEPLCLLEVSEVHLSPDIIVTEYGIDHDVSIIILTESVIESCPHLIPIAINQVRNMNDLIGEHFFMGGFGSTDGTYNFSPIRFWCLLELTMLDNYVLVMEGIDVGVGTYGDSGAGIFYRPVDEALQTFGVFTGMTDTLQVFSRFDNETRFLDAHLDRSVICGSVDALGFCLDDSIVSCDEAGFSSVDCAAQDMECQINADDEPFCECECNIEPFCEEDCACDSDCPCECDETTECNDDCLCDPNCYGQGNPDADIDGNSDAGADTGADAGADADVDVNAGEPVPQEEGCGCSAPTNRAFDSIGDLLRI